MDAVVVTVLVASPIWCTVLVRC